MKLITFIFSILLLLLAACSGGPIQVEEDEVIGEINQNQLTVFNSSDQNIYYAVFDQSILPFILWAPISTDGNKIPGFSKKSFQLSEILREGRTTGTIVFYFWTGEEPDGEAIKHLSFEVLE